MCYIVTFYGKQCITIFGYLIKSNILLYCYFLRKVMRYDIALLNKKVTYCVTLLLFMEHNALQYCVT